ncbi:MAG: ABC transporter ATP-binding protein [Firmicutes bacterium]|nr:ABC transporter ATP-binding protein [Bacillota bacterium]
MAPSALSVEGIEVKYGTVTALWDVSIKVEPGEAVAIIGANGAGKSTLLHSISGLLKPSRGRILMGGQEITGKRPEEIVKSGISQVLEGRRVFGNLTVEENLLVGAHLQTEKGSISDNLESVYRLFPRLRERRAQMGGTMSGGEQQMLAIGQALMSRPTVLMLDEPSLGLSPILVAETFRKIDEIRATGTTILVVEQNSRMALRHTDRAYVMEMGRITLSGPSAQLMKDENVKRVYLGQSLLASS